MTGWVRIPADDLPAALADPVLHSASFLNEIASCYPDAIPLAAGRPFDGFFDPREIAAALAAYQEYLLDERGYDHDQLTRDLFQYGRTAGTIHELIAQMLVMDEGIRVSPESIVVVNGAQEGLLVVAKALCHAPDDVLLVPSPCYIGMTGVAELLGITVAPVPDGPDGLDPAKVAEVASAVRSRGERPRALYVVPDFANPSGQTMPVTTRNALLSVAEAHDLLLVEDNPYGFLSGVDTQLPTLKALDLTGRVVYVGTFAKSCFPGARVGYVVADQVVEGPDEVGAPLAESLALIRSMVTVNTSSVAQSVIGGMLVQSKCRLREANLERIAFYRTNLKLLLSELDRELPVSLREALGVSWNTPAGGFFVVLTLPFPADEALLSTSARRYGVLWTPMRFFYPNGGGTHQLRLSVSAVSPSAVTEGARRIARLVRDHINVTVSERELRR